jgi:hypothetical protein
MALRLLYLVFRLLTRWESSHHLLQRPTYRS